MNSGFRCCMHLVHFRPNIFIISLQAQLHFTSIFSGQTYLVMNPWGLAEGSHFKMFLVSHTKYHQKCCFYCCLDFCISRNDCGIMSPQIFTLWAELHHVKSASFFSLIFPTMLIIELIREENLFQNEIIFITSFIKWSSCFWCKAKAVLDFPASTCWSFNAWTLRNSAKIWNRKRFLFSSEVDIPSHD